MAKIYCEDSTTPAIHKNEPDTELCKNGIHVFAEEDDRMKECVRSLADTLAKKLSESERDDYAGGA